jgi:hypothetical protein
MPAEIPASDVRPSLLRQACGVVRNVAIGGILLVVLVEAVPGVPSRIRSLVDPWARRVGFDQDQWRMFAPDPDRQNHRIYAVVEYADGSRREWRPPDWREQTRWERFLTHRQSKFAENIANPGFVDVQKPMAEWVVREIARRGDAPGAKATRVVFWVEHGKIPDPMYFPWPSVKERHPFEEKYQFGEITFDQEPQP